MSKPSSRALALIALQKWRAGEQFADAILGQLLRSSDLAAPDRAFATELFYGVLRNLRLLDFWIDSLRSRHLDHDTRDLLRLGLYQLFVLETPEHAAVFETVALARPKGRSLVNGVLRSATRGKADLLRNASEQELSVRTSHPQFLVDRWVKNFGEKDTESLCDWNNRPAPIYARINRIRVSKDEFLARHRDAEPLPAHENFVRLTNIPHEALADGHCYIQDPSTAAACLLLDPKPGDRVLDACAAPGGKTGYIAELMRNEGLILACDRDTSRVRTLQENLEKLGVGISRCVHHNWTSSDPLAEAADFDRILIDAPCTNTGVMRRRVDLRWRLAPNDFSRMHAEQLGIVRATIPLLKPDGILVYSTCSIEPEENEDVVRVILREFPFLKLADQNTLLPFRDGFDGAFAAKFIRDR
ncbi:MAG: rRNA (cytosine967-C5)-methyltransferase [Verrucomicrobiota bacterium]|jgi:16S rRNA (cytosine967-C5)-methyltransferase